MALTIDNDAAGAALATLTALVDNGGPGTLVLHAGVVPSDLAPGAYPVIAQFPLLVPAFLPPVEHPTRGVAAFLQDILAQDALLSGTVSFYRVLDGTGDVLWQGTISSPAGSGDLIVSTTSVLQGVTMSVVSFSISLPTR